MIRLEKNDYSRITQGDILSNIEFLESAKEEHGELTINLIRYPYVIVVSQDCDLQWDGASRSMPKHKVDKGINLIKGGNLLISTIVLPLYNAEHFFAGKHLESLGQYMPSFNREKTDGKNLISNTNPRYHYLEFGDDTEVPNSVIDFKHYFSVDINSILTKIEEFKVCQVSELYRENISQRFSSYLSRIGLPEKNSIEI